MNTESLDKSIAIAEAYAKAWAAEYERLLAIKRAEETKVS